MANIHILSNIPQISTNSDYESDSDFLMNLFNNTYKTDQITQSQRMKRAKENDFWFTLYNQNNENNKNNEIVAYCSVVRENDTIFEINDVYVEEQHRGNNYSGVLLKYIIKYFQEKFQNKFNKKNTIKICCELNNFPAYHSYKKIFGEPYRADNRIAYFVY
jgi:predicted GNAT family N-acyltransferase